jgi:hypothetical protein
MALVFASHLCEMCAMCCKKRKSNLDLASKRLSLSLEVELAGCSTGRVSFWFHTQAQDTVGCPTWGEPRSQSSCLTSHIALLRFQTSNNNLKISLIKTNPHRPTPVPMSSPGWARLARVQSILRGAEGNYLFAKMKLQKINAKIEIYSMKLKSNYTNLTKWNLL